MYIYKIMFELGSNKTKVIAHVWYHKRFLNLQPQC